MVVDFTVVALFFTETLAKHYGAAAGRPSSAPLGRKDVQCDTLWKLEVQSTAPGPNITKILPNVFRMLRKHHIKPRCHIFLL